VHRKHLSSCSQKEQLDKQYVTQFSTLFVLVVFLPDSEEQDFLYATLYDSDCSLKRKRENDEEQKFKGSMW
jgi:hypothetical protein